MKQLYNKVNDIFLAVADAVSFGMGTWPNIMFWVVAVAVWIALGPEIAKTNILPEWFTSTSFNFPLNTVTTLAELYIGFLVAAAANRNERHNEVAMAKLESLEQRILEHLENDK